MDNLTVIQRMNLVKELPKEFIIKKVHESTQKCLVSPCQYNDMDLEHWTSMLFIKILIDLTGFDQACRMFKDIGDAVSFYKILKQ